MILIMMVLITMFCGFVLMMSQRIIALVLGILMLGNGINVIIFLLSDPQNKQAVFIKDTAQQGFNDPVPQAIVLTAIVIGFAILAYLVSLSKALLNEFPDGRLSQLNNEE